MNFGSLFLRLRFLLNTPSKFTKLLFGSDNSDGFPSFGGLTSLVLSADC